MTSPDVKTFQTYGCRSLKLTQRFIHPLLRQQWDPADRTRVIDSLKESLFSVVESLPDSIGVNNIERRIKAVPFFVRALECMVILFHAVNYLMQVPQNNQENAMSLKFGSVIKFFILLAQDLPGHASD